MVNIWHSQRYSQSSGHLDMRREPEVVAYKVRRPDILTVETHCPSKHLDDYWILGSFTSSYTKLYLIPHEWEDLSTLLSAIAG
jgi:hypothetical protein